MGKNLNKSPVAKRQRGVVLFIALIALVAMTLAGLALMRSVDTSNVIAGNFAFKESTLHAADLGTEIAISGVPGSPALSAIINADGTTVAFPNKYFPIRQLVDAQGIPITVDWTAVPVVNSSNGNSVQYVVERMCDPIPASAGNPASGIPAVVAAPNGPSQTSRGDVSDYCVTIPQCSPGVSINTPPFCVAGDINYRITTRVTGPRGTVSVVQSVVTM